MFLRNFAPKKPLDAITSSFMKRVNNLNLNPEESELLLKDLAFLDDVERNKWLDDLISATI